MARAATQNPAEIIALPKGGGALHGLGEKFTPDLQTGTGNFSVPLQIPAGRNGFGPSLTLAYSTGAGNGPFGLGWSLSVPGVARQTAHGIPRYGEATDVFIITGAEDLVPVGESGGARQYRPRTEGLFARILHVRGAGDDHWEVTAKDGIRSTYGTAAAAGRDPAALTDPADATHVFAWKLTETRDLFGNRVLYDYEADEGAGDGHRWCQPLLSRVRYVDYDTPEGERFLVSVTLEYEPRPDPFSDYRAGFELRTTRRCRAIVVRTHADRDRLVRRYELAYDCDVHTGLSLLRSVQVWGFDDAGVAVSELPPLEFGYTDFDPSRRDLRALSGAELPAGSLGAKDFELADLSGDGLPDILETNGTVRWWPNLGDGRFDAPRTMREAPAGIHLADPGVQLVDADGDGRADLLVTTAQTAGYYPLGSEAVWDRRSFHRHAAAPTFSLEDPEVRLVDLDGDGVTDAIRAGTRLECFFNDPERGFEPERTRYVARRRLEEFPNVSFSDPRVKWADMTGDGMQDIVLVHDGRVDYWPNLGRGDWGARITMRNSPRLPATRDPRRVLLGDVNGDGAADLVYVEDGSVTLWINRSGNGWSDPIVIRGTPRVTDQDAVRLVDLLGTGVAGLLWSADRGATARTSLFFLDFVGGRKPYLLDRMVNNIGAVTRVEYVPSTRFQVEDAARPATRWKTTLPFPVHVVARVEVIDEISKGKLTTRYRYHHGYWDGLEREFRGFGMVEQYDTEDFESYNAAGLHGEGVEFAPVADREQFSPPTLTKSWFHLGPVSEADGEWSEADFSGEYWAEDPGLPAQAPEADMVLRGLAGRARRDALRALRGSALRTELFGLDGSEREARPYTVTCRSYGVRELAGVAVASVGSRRVFFPHVLVERTAQWERGDDPMVSLAFTDDYDEFGQPRQKTSCGMPRRSARRALSGRGDWNETRVLATHERTERVQPGGDLYVHDRVAHTRVFELAAPPEVAESTPEDLGRVLTEQEAAARAVHSRFGAALDAWTPGDALPADVRLLTHVVNHYDGAPFVGRGAGAVGPWGALVRTEALAFTDEDLDAAYGADRPAYLGGSAPLPDGAPAGFGADLGYRREARSDAGYHDGWYMDTLRAKRDVQNAGAGSAKGLVAGMQDALGNETAIVPDVYAFLPERVIDPLGLEQSATYDYRVLQPGVVTDINGNETRFDFTPLGLLAATWARGKPGAGEGDQVVPGATLSYDFRAFYDSPDSARRPICARGRKRIRHDTDAPASAAERDAVAETIEYSDGFGRVIQMRTRGDDLQFGDPLSGGTVLPAAQGAPQTGDAVVGRRCPPDAPHVVVSGWQVYDNKGRAVARYEPFRSVGWSLEPFTAVVRDRLAPPIRTVHDARGRPLRIIRPDGAEVQIVVGVPRALDDPDDFAPTAWESFTYKEEDNAGRTPAADAAANGYAHQWNTPDSSGLDALGRVLVTATRYRAPAGVTAAPLPPPMEYRMRSAWSVTGDLRRVVDPLGRVAQQTVYDRRQQPLRRETLDGGAQSFVPDARSLLVQEYDAKGALRLRGHDALGRPVWVRARDAVGVPLTMRERLSYGDASDPGQAPAEREAQRALNRLGRLRWYYDEAGLVEFERYDFKGNVVERARRTISDDVLVVAIAAGGVNAVDWSVADAERMLDGTAYRTTRAFDALNRVVTLHVPDDVTGGRRAIHQRYSQDGGLEHLDLDGVPYIEHAAYDVLGRPAIVAYGNGLLTRRAYDPVSLRLVRIRTERCKTTVDATGLTLQPVSTDAPLQDLTYRYDLAGNVQAIADRTPDCGIAGTLAGADSLERAFTYDSLHRLVSATGRECRSLSAPRSWDPWRDPTGCGYAAAGRVPSPTPENASALTVKYWERFEYDAAGNLTALRHGSNGAAAWTRHFGMGGLSPSAWETAWQAHVNDAQTWVNAPGDRLTHAGDDMPGAPQSHTYDAAGNLLRQHEDRQFVWDHADRLREFRIQAPGGPASLQVRYLYDASGQRVKKLVWTSGGIESTTYIEGVFEHRRQAAGGSIVEHDLLHLIDADRRVAIVRVGDAFPDDGAPDVDVQYQFGDHLESSAVVTDADGRLINREEFFPFGETSFGSFARKRYRFAGKERDEESGLMYHGVRYYAPWLARWTSCDPDLNVNRYAYVGQNPYRYVDPDGRGAVVVIAGVVVVVGGGVVVAGKWPKDPSGMLAAAGPRTKQTVYMLDVFNGWFDPGRPSVSSVTSALAPPLGGYELRYAQKANRQEVLDSLQESRFPDIWSVLGHGNEAGDTITDAPYLNRFKITAADVTAAVHPSSPPAVGIFAGCWTAGPARAPTATPLIDAALRSGMKVAIGIAGKPATGLIPEATQVLVKELAEGKTLGEALTDANKMLRGSITAAAAGGTPRFVAFARPDVTSAKTVNDLSWSTEPASNTDFREVTVPDAVPVP